MLNRRGLAFLDVDVDRDAVARQFFDVGVDRLRHSAPARRIAAIEFEVDALERRLLEDLAFFQALLAEPLHQRVGLDRLVALELDRVDRGTLDHGDDQRVAVARESDVAKIARLEQQTDQLADRRLVDLIADVDRQQIEHRSRGHALQPLNADVRHGERIGERKRSATTARWRAIASSFPQTWTPSDQNSRVMSL